MISRSQPSETLGSEAKSGCMHMGLRPSVHKACTKGSPTHLGLPGTAAKRGTQLRAARLAARYGVASVVLLILAPLAGQLIKLSVSRNREYLADAQGALMPKVGSQFHALDLLYIPGRNFRKLLWHLLQRTVVDKEDVT